MGIVAMELYVIEEYVILHMADTVLNDYSVFQTKEAALKHYSDVIIASDYGNDELALEREIEKSLNRMFGVARVLVTKTPIN